MPTLRVLVPSCMALLLAGCGSPPRDQGFADVAEQVRERSGVEARWLTGGKEDADVAARVDALLAAPLTPKSAVQVALLNNPRLHATYQELGISQAELVQAGLLRNPAFGAGITFFAAGPAVELSLAQDLLGVFAIPARRRLAAAELEGAKARVAGAIIDLIGEVRRAVHRSDAARLRLDLRRQSFAALEASTDLAKRVHDAGNSSDLQFATEQAALEEARIALAQEEDAELGAREDLAVLLGLWGRRATGWTTTNALPALPDDDGTGDGTGMETQAIRASLDLAAQRAAIRALGEHYGVERLDAWFGEVEAGAKAEREADGEWGAGPEVGIALPIFDHGQGRKAEASARLEMAARTYLATAVDIRSQVRRVRAQVRGAFAQARHHAQVLVPLRAKAVEETLLHYNGMLASPFQLIAARRDEFAARYALVDATARFWIARSLLDQLRSGRMVHPLSDVAPTMGTSMENGHD